MIEKFNVRLFLTDSEREHLLKLEDTLHEIDFDNEEQMKQAYTWCKIIGRLVFGKKLPDRAVSYPMSLTEKDRE